ncbi:MAG: hypothetical protein RJA29_1161, partial [Pseudomonadota bacterium]
MANDAQQASESLQTARHPQQTRSRLQGGQTGVSAHKDRARCTELAHRWAVLNLLGASCLLLPSLAALQAFEASARHLSFTRAAEELNLSQGAISRQVLALESALGVPLFARVRQRISLTPAGASYAEEVRDALNRLSAATLNAVA